MGVVVTAFVPAAYVVQHYSAKPEVAELAADYGFGLAKNHPFNDANKRTALISMHLFRVFVLIMAILET